MRFRVFFCLCLVAACGAKPPQKDWQAGERGTVSRIIDGDTFALNTGQVVRLASIEAPAFGYRGDEDDPYAEKSKRELEDLILGRNVQLYYPGLTRDKYDRALAQVVLSDDPSIWVNAEMVRRGGAWVRIYPDTSKGSEPLWPMEMLARQTQTGVWRENNSPELASGIKDLPDRKFVILTDLVSSSQISGDVCETVFTSSPVRARHEPIGQKGACLPSGTKRLEVRGWLNQGVIKASQYSIRIEPVTN